MTTTEKDFKVKNGLIVTDGGSFGGTVVVAEPTESTHAVTKSYVDSRLVVVQDTAPEDPIVGMQWFNTTNSRMNIYFNDAWTVMATYNDVINLPQHIHDTSIGGDGLIVSIFQDGGFYDGDFVSITDAGYYNLNEWAMTWNGGIAIDNFN
jgi:hypothetical protein